MSSGQALLRGVVVRDQLPVRFPGYPEDKEDALRRMAQGTVSPYARRSDPSGLCSVWPIRLPGGWDTQGAGIGAYARNTRNCRTRRSHWQTSGETLLKVLWLAIVPVARHSNAATQEKAVEGGRRASVRVLVEVARETGTVFAQDEFIRKMDDILQKQLYAARNETTTKL